MNKYGMLLFAALFGAQISGAMGPQPEDFISQAQQLPSSGSEAQWQAFIANVKAFFPKIAGALDEIITIVNKLNATNDPVQKVFLKTQLATRAATYAAKSGGSNQLLAALYARAAQRR